MGRFLQALFPDSSLVVVVRHPLVTALALQKWNPRIFSRNGRRHTSLYGLVAHWVKAHELLLSDAPFLRRLHVVRYEDLVRSPVEEFSRLQGFLGLATPLPRELFRADRSSAYAQQWDEMRRGGPLARHRAAIVDRLGPRVAVFGYEIDDLEPSGPLPDLLPR
jgi:hypothetical protein